MKVWNIGYPRIGRKRELKKALELYWAGEISAEALEKAGKSLMAARWARQHDLGVESIPLNDFSFYDPMLDMNYLLGLTPKRFQGLEHPHWLDSYFTMARGKTTDKANVAALDMTKWFNTNYHYLVPEIDSSTQFKLRWDMLCLQLEHARSYPYNFHATLIGPFTYVKMAQLNGVGMSDVLQKIVPLYSEILKEFKKRGLSWVQMEEPALCLDLHREDLRSVRKTYEDLAGKGPNVLIATYFDACDPWLSEIASLQVQGIHLDLVHGPANLSWLKTKVCPKEKVLSLGVVNGRNIWAAPLHEMVRNIRQLLETYSTDKVFLAPSCSLAHLPIDKTLEKEWDEELLSWVSFADQRLEELTVLKRAVAGDKAMEAEIQRREKVLNQRQISSRIHLAEVKQALERIEPRMRTRKSSFAKRMKAQGEKLRLPLLPTTTIGSFPQTQEIRKQRLEFKKGRITQDQYDAFLKKEIMQIVRLQEKLGLDVLVHGEPERSDMVEFFAELLDGFIFSQEGWVQSYGSRCVKPPILLGDVRRKQPMTVEWYQHAQSLTKKPVKGMLTGPVTILNWSFVREDQPREKTCFQVALAIREEVAQLEQAGARIIQIDEAALREGLPIKKVQWSTYLRWATEAFRLCTSGVEDGTQIQTHMCYSEFGDIMDAINRLDADVLLIEFTRSGEAFSQTFRRHRYENQIGPGVYDTHSPRVLSKGDVEQAIRKLLEVFSADKLWIVPDCGLKTRQYKEVEASLSNMVAGASSVRTAILSK